MYLNFKVLTNQKNALSRNAIISPLGYHSVNWILSNIDHEKIKLG